MKSDTGAKSFECLILQIARGEGNLLHCERNHENNDPLYCEGNIDKLQTGDNKTSLGVMQINTQVHSDVDVADFEENVEFGIDLLINNYNNPQHGLVYKCYRPKALGGVVRESDFEDKAYSGWQRSLREYNGWNSLCTRVNEETGELEAVGNPDYVNYIMDLKDEVGVLFPECAS